MDIILELTQELNVEKWQVEAAVKLIDEGNTIPFISRYRKEVTGALNDEVLTVPFASHKNQIRTMGVQVCFSYAFFMPVSIGFVYQKF